MYVCVIPVSWFHIHMLNVLGRIATRPVDMGVLARGLSSVIHLNHRRLPLYRSSILAAIGGS